MGIVDVFFLFIVSDAVILAIDPTDKEAAEYKRQLTGGKAQANGNNSKATSGVNSNSVTGGSKRKAVFYS